MSKYAFEITLGLTGTLALWLGILNIGERSGLVHKLAKGLSLVLLKLFPIVPSNHPALGKYVFDNRQRLQAKKFFMSLAHSSSSTPLHC